MFLPPHLSRAHQLSATDYRQRHQIPASVPLAGARYVANARARLQRAHADGTIHNNPQRASEAARGAGRGVLTLADREKQAAIARRIGPKPVLTALGATRADGRNAERAREYQRRYRADPVTAGPPDLANVPHANALLRALLAHTGLSQVKLAREIGISERTVRRIVAGGAASPLAADSIARYAQRAND